MDKGKKQLVLNKGSEKYIFRYETGCESELLDSLVEQADNDMPDMLKSFQKEYD